MILAEVLGHEFNATLHNSRSITDVNNLHGCVYAFEISSTSARDENTRPDNAHDFISIIALSCDVKKDRRFVFISNSSSFPSLFQYHLH